MVCSSPYIMPRHCLKFLSWLVFNHDKQAYHSCNFKIFFCNMHSFENWEILLGYFPVTTCYNCYSWGIFSQVMCLAQLRQEKIFDGLQAPIPSRKQLWQVVKKIASLGNIIYLITGPVGKRQLSFLKNLCFPRQRWGGASKSDGKSNELFPKRPVIKGLFWYKEGGLP